jgi:hypothetical protein
MAAIPSDPNALLIRVVTAAFTAALDGHTDPQ